MPAQQDLLGEAFDGFEELRDFDFVAAGPREALVPIAPVQDAKEVEFNNVRQEYARLLHAAVGCLPHG